MAASTACTQYVDGIWDSSSYRLVAVPTPTGATATAQLDYGFVVGAVVTSGGSGYVAAPSVSIVGGGGGGAQATTTVSGGAVTAINIIDAGYGYTSMPSIQIDPPPVPALVPGVTPALRLDCLGMEANLTYQLQVSPDLDGWANFGATFLATAVTNSQYLDVEDDNRFFRLHYVP